MKRLFDVIVSLSVLVAFSPILLLVALLVRTKLGSPIFFTQIRPGLHGKPFKMVKFRTLTEQKDELGNYLPDADRLTSFGALLRSTSLDELPELWNVLKGDMSLVGPRPLLMEYLPLYTPEQYRRHEVRHDDCAGEVAACVADHAFQHRAVAQMQVPVVGAADGEG